ncbi:MAG: exonuclease SbcCD subunit D [Wujia sp.]
MKFIHIADVNLGAQPDRGRIWSDTRAKEIYDTFHKVIQVCEEQKIELLLIAGNLYHTKPTEQDLKDLDFQLRKIPATKTVIIAGDRDYIDPGSPWETYEFESNTIVLPRDQAASVYLEDLNVCVTGYSYGHATYTGRILERMRPGKEGAYNILLGHGGDMEHMPFSKERVARLGFQYVALGHMHKPAHVLKNQMAFAGTLEPLSYTETGKHGYILGEVSDAGETTITFVPFSCRRYVNMALDVNLTYTNGDICNLVEGKMQELGVDNIYRIMLRGRIAQNMEINLSELTRRYCINEIIDKTICGFDMEELRTTNDGNLLGEIMERFSDEAEGGDPQIREKALHYCMESLLRDVSGFL